MFEKIRSFLDPIYLRILGTEYSQRDYVILSAIILISIPIIAGQIILGVYLLFGGNLTIDLTVMLVICVTIGLGLFSIWLKKLTAARYLVVWLFFGFSLWGTIWNGFSFMGVLSYVITMLLAYLVISRRQVLVIMIIVIPPILYRFFSSPESYNQVNIWAYVGMMSVVGFLLGLLNYLNEQAKTKLVQINELEAIQQAGVSVMSSLNLQETTSKILEELENILPHDSASVLLMRNPNEIELVACSGWENPYDVIGIRFPVPGDNPNTVVIQEGRPHILNNAPVEYPPFLEEPHNHILSWLGVPLITKGEIIGMMAIDSRQKGYFSEENIQVVSAFADQVAIAIENARLFDFANQAAKRQSILYRASQEVIRAGSDLEYIYRSIHSAASELMPTEAFVITLMDETEKFIEGAYLIDRSGRNQNLRIPLDQGMSGTVIQTGESILETDLLATPEFGGEHFGHEDDVRSLVAVPFSIGNKVIGMLSAQSYKANAYGQEELELLQLLAAQAGVAIENARLLTRMEHMANTDPLTGLRNRRAFDRSLADEIHRADRYGYSLSLMVMDIDDFKQFNDRFGHSRGDEHLIQIANLTRESVREPDIVARIGGEEFSVILPHTSREGAAELAERVRINIENAFKDKFQVGRTVSIGVAAYPRDGGNAAELFDAADLVMFRIKRSGKNQVGIPIEEDQS